MAAPREPNSPAPYPILERGWEGGARNHTWPLGDDNRSSSQRPQHLLTCTATELTLAVSALQSREGEHRSRRLWETSAHGEHGYGECSCADRRVQMWRSRCSCANRTVQMWRSGDLPGRVFKCKQKSQVWRSRRSTSTSGNVFPSRNGILGCC